MTGTSSMTESCTCKRLRSGLKSRSKECKRGILRGDAALALVKRRKIKITASISLAEAEGDLARQQDLLEGGVRKERGADLLVQLRGRTDLKIGRGDRLHLPLLLHHQATVLNHKTLRNHQIWND